MGRWVVSVKGVLIWGSCVVLVRNDRAEWELPGGQLAGAETLEECVEREIAEELFVEAQAISLLDSYVFEVVPDARVVIVTFGCEALRPQELRRDEHDAVALVPLDELDAIALPAGYRKSIEVWRDRLASR